MQVGEPINDPVADAHPRIGGSQRLYPVGEILNHLGNSEIDPACPEYDKEAKAPEADHAVQVPDEALPSHAARHRQAATPSLVTWPPDRQAGNGKHQQSE